MQSVLSKVQRRLRWYKGRFQVNNPVVGRAVELLGNKVRMDGLIYSVDAPQITRGHKSTLAFGLHEMEERELIRRWLPSDVPVIEFGGGLGVVACLTNRKLYDPSQHIVVEANPIMAKILERNRCLNDCRFQVVNKAIAYDCHHIDLNLDNEFVGSSTKGYGEKSVRVATTNIAATMASGRFDQAGIVCDIEGTEFDVIQKEFPVLGDKVRFLMAEMHPAILGNGVIASLMNQLSGMGFSLKQQAGDSVFLSR